MTTTAIGSPICLRTFIEGKGYEDFSVGKTFRGWPLIEPIFYTDPIPPPKKQTFSGQNLAQPSPPLYTQKPSAPESFIQLSHGTKVWQKTYPICDAPPLSRSALLSFAPSKKSRRHNRPTVDFRDDLVQGIGIRQIILS